MNLNILSLVLNTKIAIGATIFQINVLQEKSIQSNNFMKSKQLYFKCKEK